LDGQWLLVSRRIGLRSGRVAALDPWIRDDPFEEQRGGVGQSASDVGLVVQGIVEFGRE
jgi:hypothetical protein